MHQHLDIFEQEAASNRSELADLKQIYNSAKHGQESARANRLTLEHDVYHNKQIRDKTLFETRKKAKESAQMPDISTNRWVFWKLAKLVRLYHARSNIRYKHVFLRFHFRSVTETNSQPRSVYSTSFCVSVLVSFLTCVQF